MLQLLQWKNSITYSEYVFVALGIQNAKRLRRIVLSSSAFQVSQNYFTFSHIRRDFRGGGG